MSGETYRTAITQLQDKVSKMDARIRKLESLVDVLDIQVEHLEQNQL